MIIDGKHIAEGILKKLQAQPKPAKFLAAVLAGDDKSSVSFLAQKEKTAKLLGVDFRLYKFPADIKHDKLREEVGKIGSHKSCGGVIVQLPLPEQLNWCYVLNAIPPEKDVDVLGERTIGAFYVGRSTVLPPAVSTVEAFVEDSKLTLEHLNVAVVGLGLLVGRPIANWIMRRAKETFLLRSTSDLTVLKKADLVITGVGKSRLIKAEMLKDGARVIDFGYQDGTGDFDSMDLGIAEGKNISYTPTPGGTGPVLVAKLFENFYKLNS